MKASVIIATYGRNSCLVDTIQSVLHQDYPDFELLVIDQSAEHEPEVETFLRTVDDPRYSYYLITPPSLPAARNFGRTQSNGDIIIYIDDDVTLSRDFIRSHVHAYERSERVGAVGGRVHVPGQEPFTQLFYLAADGSWKGGYDFPEEGELISAQGCNMSYRRSILEEIGGFDSSYQGNALREESDVCFRIRRHGHQVWFEPKAMLDHLLASTGGCREQDLRNSDIYYQNETLFHLKNLPLRFFGYFLLTSLRNHVWPLKHSFAFWTRLKALLIGVPRGLWFVLFPKKLFPIVVWKLTRTENVHASHKVQS